MNRKIKRKIKEKTTNNKIIIKDKKEKKDIQKNNFTLIQCENEPTFFYNIRKNFVELLNPDNKKEFELYIMYSHVFTNMFFLKCRYQENTEEFINNFLKKYNKKFLYKIQNDIFIK